MKSFPTKELKIGSYCSSDIYLDQNFLLGSTLVPISEELINALLDWDFLQVFSDGAFLSSLEIQKDKPNYLNENETITFTDKIKAQLKQIDTTTESTIHADKKRIELIKAVYDDCTSYIHAVYTRYTTHKELNVQAISQTMQHFCSFVRNNRPYVFQIAHSSSFAQKDFLISHSMRSTVYAVGIGIELNLPFAKLVELGIACIIHELGMLKIPPQLYMNNRPLTTAQKKQIFKHPILGYDILKSYGFPLSINLAVLEHHEKENGTGYPRKLTGEKTSMLAKIIAVTCSFEALTAPREHREAQSSHEAMIEIVQQSNKSYDATVAKALLNILSFYPIGSYVYLSSGQIGLVINSNKINPKFPLIEIVNSNGKTETRELIQISETTTKITRALTQIEVDDLLKSLKTA